MKDKVNTSILKSKSTNLLFILFIALVLNSCKNSSLLYSSIHLDWEKKYGTCGQTSIQTISLPYFNSIRCNGDFEIELLKSDSCYITLCGDSILIPYFKYYHEGNQLNFYFKRGSRLPHGKIKVTVHAPEINSVIKIGSGRLTFNDSYTSETIYLKQIGAGKIIANCNSPKLNCKVVGSGSIICNGNIEQVRADKVGSGVVVVNGKKIYQ